MEFSRVPIIYIISISRTTVVRDQNNIRLVITPLKR